jgi:hypothetical protein
MSELRPVLGVLGRLIWMLLGPIALLGLLVLIGANGNGWFTAADLAFFVVLALMLAGRWLEFYGGNPQTADGEPATPRHLHRYWLGAGLGGLACWVAANLVGNHWLGG